jgi:hypothetical protein
MKTVGLSPKITAVLAAVGGPGVVLLILGLILDDETLRTIGLSLLGGSVVGGGAGFQAPPGDVVVDPAKAPPSDELLDPEVEARIRAGESGEAGLEPIVRLLIGVVVLLVVLWVLVRIVDALV